MQPIESDRENQMTKPRAAENDPLAGWDPRRRAALERLRKRFKDAGATGTDLSDELIAERRQAAAAEDHEADAE